MVSIIQNRRLPRRDVEPAVVDRPDRHAGGVQRDRPEGDPRRELGVEAAVGRHGELGQDPRGAVAPLPLHTDRPQRVVAWPSWEDPADVQRMLRDFGPALGGREDVCLCLRLDPATDPPKPAIDVPMQLDLDALVAPDPTS